MSCPKPSPLSVQKKTQSAGHVNDLEVSKGGLKRGKDTLMLVLAKGSFKIDCPLQSRVNLPLPLAHSDFPTAHFFLP